MKEPTGWLPHLTAQIPLPQLLALFSGPEAGPGEYMSAAEVLARQNRRRAEAGLPPIKPRPRTFAEARRQKEAKKSGH